MSEQAVIVHFRYGQTDLSPLFELEDQLKRAIDVAGVGEFDGNDVATDICTCMAPMQTAYSRLSDLYLNLLHASTTQSPESAMDRQQMALRKEGGELAPNYGTSADG